MEIGGLLITGYQLVFIIVAGITLLSAVCMALVPNILKASLFLGLTLFFVAGIYALLNAPFLAVAQVMVYVGAVTTMIVLAVFVSNKVMKVGFFDAIYNPLFSAAAAGLAFLFLTAVVANSLWLKRITDVGPTGFEMKDIAYALLQPYVFPFELVSVILLACLIGAVVVAKEDDNG